jgi:uncharacterized membrane protein
MEAWLQHLAGRIALVVEVAAVLIVAYGAVEAFVEIARTIAHRTTTLGARKMTWLRFGVWLLLGLEFELAADIVRSVIAPSWAEIGQLAAIAVIRTFLNFFLERDLEAYREPPSAAEPVEALRG